MGPSRALGCPRDRKWGWLGRRRDPGSRDRSQADTGMLPEFSGISFSGMKFPTAVIRRKTNGYSATYGLLFPFSGCCLGELPALPAWKGSLWSVDPSEITHMVDLILRKKWHQS